MSAAALIGPNPSGVGLAGQRTGEDAWPGVKVGRCDGKRPAGSDGFLACAPSGLLRGIGLPPPGVVLLWDCCPGSESRES